jgi:hypothetical protein
MQGIGFTDEISEHQIAAVTAALRDHSRTIAPPSSPSTSQLCGPMPSPCQPHRPARSASCAKAPIYEVIQAVLGPDHMHEPPEAIAQYRPHVSVAYINAPGPAQPIVSALQVARPEAVTIAIDSASVLTFHRDNRMYEWTAATRPPIGKA